VNRPGHCCLLSILFAIGCATRSATKGESSRSQETAAPSSAVSLYRSPCYGGCPAYSVSVTADGLVTYEGRDGVLERGTKTAQIPKQRVDALLRELDAAGYFDFAVRYRPSERVCGRYVPDAPSVITSVRLGQRSKQIEHDHGCGAAPLALNVLESRIDEVLGSERWTGRAKDRTDLTR
jgi:hypothetical protein